MPRPMAVHVKVAQILNQKISDSTLVDIKKEKIDPNLFDTIILGSSIYIGQVDKHLKNFISMNMDVLKSKRVGIYLCCGFEENVQTYLDTNFDKETGKQSCDHDHGWGNGCKQDEFCA
jgi:menaquinone-dependent protoporphyrinogen oxidase